MHQRGLKVIHELTKFYRDKFGQVAEQNATITMQQKVKFFELENSVHFNLIIITIYMIKN